MGYVCGGIENICTCMYLEPTIFNINMHVTCTCSLYRPSGLEGVLAGVLSGYFRFVPLPGRTGVLRTCILNMQYASTIHQF